MEYPPTRGATGWQRPESRSPDWHGTTKTIPTPAPPPLAFKPRNGFDRFKGVVVRRGRVDNTEVHMREIEQMRRLVADDSWMDKLSRAELIELRDRTRMLASNLSKIQNQLRPFKR